MNDAVSELRNSLVHRVENINFTFSKYVEGLDKNQKKNFVETLTPPWTTDELRDGWRTIIETSPKMAVEIMLFSLMHHCSLAVGRRKLKIGIAEVGDETTTRIINELLKPADAKIAPDKEGAA